MAEPTPIQTGLEVAAKSAAPTPAPIATPTPTENPGGLLLAMSVMLPVAMSEERRAKGGRTASRHATVSRVLPGATRRRARSPGGAPSPTRRGC